MNQYELLNYITSFKDNTTPTIVSVDVALKLVSLSSDEDWVSKLTKFYEYAGIDFSLEDEVIVNGKSLSQSIAYSSNMSQLENTVIQRLSSEAAINAVLKKTIDEYFTDEEQDALILSADNDIIDFDVNKVENKNKFLLKLYILMNEIRVLHTNHEESGVNIPVISTRLPITSMNRITKHIIDLTFTKGD